MASTIDFNVSTNAVTVLNQTANAAESTAKGFTSAKAELRALNNQLLTMDQTSDAFKKASARAAELKDNISDLGAEINANAGNAFEGLSNNVGLFGSRLMSLDLKGAGQALSGMGAAVGKIDFKTIKEEIGGLIQGLGKLAKAVLANPYLMLAAAIALIVANFDTIIKQFPAIEKGLTGINEQERELLDLQTKKAEQAKKNYDNISAMENTLKLQGKTEKEIRDMKITAIAAAIQEARVRLETQRGQEKAQIETAQRNREILEGVIRWINAPLYLLLATVDKIASWVGQTTNLAEGLTNLAAGLLIDPEQQQEDLKKSFEEQENTITAMQNSLDGFINEQKEKDKAARDKASEERKKTDEEIKKELEDKKKLYKEQRDAEIEIEDEKYKALQAIQETAQEKEITAAVEASEELYTLAGDDAAAQVLIAENLAKKIAEINKKYKDAATEEEKKAKQQQLQDLQKIIDAADENNIMQQYSKLQQELIANDAHYQQLISQAKAAGLATTALTEEQARKENEIKKKYQDDDKKLAIDNANAKLEIAQQGLTALTALGDAYFSTQLANVQKGSKAELDLKKKQFAFNKKLQIGGAIMDTAKAITAAIAANPFPSPTLPVSIALASITGAAQIAKIASTKFDGGGGGSGGVNIPTTGGDGTTAPSPANFAFLQNQPNQQPPLQAYVVSSQVSSNLEAQQLIQNQSKLGG